jgi:WD40 repeat protein
LDGAERLLDGITGEEVARSEHASTVRVLEFSPDGSRLAVGQRQRDRAPVRCPHGRGDLPHRTWRRGLGPNLQPGWGTPGQREPRRRRAPHRGRLGRGDRQDQARRSGLGPGLQPDGSQLATGSEDGTARLLNGVTGEQVAQFEQDGPVWQVAFSPDGALLATGSDDGAARLFEQTAGTRVARFEQGRPVYALAWSLTAQA